MEGVLWTRMVCSWIFICAFLNARAAPPGSQCSERLSGDDFVEKLRAHGIKEADDPLRGKCKAPGPDFPDPQLEGEQHTVSVQLEPGGQPVPMKYRIQRGTGEMKNPRKTVVYFPGGPGPSSNHPRDIHHAPADADVILLDYPGLGENKDVKVSNPDHAYSMRGAGRYAMAVIAQLQNAGDKSIGDNYTLYGLSYGTTAATVTASMLSKQDKIKKPKGVFLDAVVGTVMTPPDTMKAATDKVWALVPEDMRAKVKAKFAEVTSVTGQTRTHEMLDFLFGAPAGNPNAEEAKTYYQWLLNSANEDILGCAMALIKKGQVASNHRPSAYCEFINNGTPDNGNYGDLLPDSIPAMCKCSPSKIKGSWNAAEHPVKDIPLFFRNGGADDLTTTAQAQTACSTQTGTTTAFYEDTGGKHEFFLAGKDEACKKGVWDTVFSGQTASWTAAAQKCAPGRALTCGNGSRHDTAPDRR